MSPTVKLVAAAAAVLGVLIADKAYGLLDQTGVIACLVLIAIALPVMDRL